MVGSLRLRRVEGKFNKFRIYWKCSHVHGGMHRCHSFGALLGFDRLWILSTSAYLFWTLDYEIIGASFII